MKNTLLLTFLCLSTSLIGQIRQDTVLNRWGQIANIKHFSKIDTKKVSKSYLFQRGLNLGDEVWQLDSISGYNDEGKFIRTRNISELDQIKDTHVPQVKQRLTQMSKEGILDAYTKQIRVTGYAGQQHIKTLTFTLPNQEAFQFKLISGPGNVKVKGLSKAVSEKRHELTLGIHLLPGHRQQIIRLQGPQGETYDVRLVLRGYDLTEKDFIPGNDFSDLKQIDARERENLYLRLESTEKLLNLYQGNKLRYHFPVGRQVDIIPVYQLPPGNYRMEVIDLSTGKKRSYGLKR
jgi:hypothetical protein